MRSPIQNETFKKLIQKARRMARPAKTQKKLDHSSFETDFTKLTYRARRLARRATPAKSCNCPVGSATSTMSENGNTPLAILSSNASLLCGTSIQQFSTSTVAHAIQPEILHPRLVQQQAQDNQPSIFESPPHASTMVWPPSAPVDKLPLPGTTCIQVQRLQPMIDFQPAKIFAPTSSALLRQGIANQVVLPAMTRPVLFEAVQPSFGQPQAQIIQAAVNMLRRSGMSPLQQQCTAPAQWLSVPSLPLLIPGILSQQPHNFAQGFHLPPSLAPFHGRLGTTLSANPVASFAAPRL